MGPDVVLTFGALVFLIGVVVRGRRRTKCLELELQNIKNRRSRSLQEAENNYNDQRLVKMVDYCRQLEARVQNRSLLLEILIEDADQRIEKLANGEGLRKSIPLGSKCFKDEFIHQIEMGKSPEELAEKWDQPVLVMDLLKDLWIHKAFDDEAKKS